MEDSTAMRQEEMKRLIVESVAERGINSVREDPERSVRKLVDLGQDFSKGRFQKQFFRLCEHLLADDDSPYYRLLIALVHQADAKRLRTFGVNLGWQSWTVGANRIREIEGREGFQVPWSLTFHLGARDSFLDPERFDQVLAEGEDLGIYTAWLDGGACEDLAPYFACVRRRENTAFLLLLRPEQAEKSLDQLRACPNLIPLLSICGDSWSRVGELLRQNGIPFGYHLYYQKERLELWRRRKEELPRWLDRVFSSGGPFLCFQAEESADPETVETVCRAVRDFRNQPTVPIFPLDFYTDCNYVDGIISDDVSFLGICADGGINRCEKGREAPAQLNLEGHSLRELLQLLYPKRQG